MDIDSTPWWAALQHRELRIQRCRQCDRLRWPARAMCNECCSFDAAWVLASGTGVVVSWTVTHHSFGPAVDVPFVVVLVRLDDQDDIYMPGYIDAPNDGHTMFHHMAVSVGFDSVDTADGQSLTVIRWQPTS